MRFVEFDDLASGSAFQGRDDVGTFSLIIEGSTRSRQEGVYPQGVSNPSDQAAEGVSGREEAPGRHPAEVHSERGTVWIY